MSTEEQVGSADEARTTVDARQAFEQLGRIVLSEQSMESVLQRVADLAKRVLPGVAEASVSLVTDDTATTVVSTGSLAKDLDESQYDRGYGPCLDAARGGEAMEITDARAERRWPDYAKRMVERGALSSLSVPVPVQKQVQAALNLYGLDVEAFDDDSRELARAFAAYAGVAVANMHLYDSTRKLAEQLEAAMASRAVIDQAKGILMGQRRCSAQEAFDLLVELSQHSNRKLRTVAQALVDEAAGDGRAH
jgi:GAF domain-containing protein